MFYFPPCKERRFLEPLMRVGVSVVRRNRPKLESCPHGDGWMSWGIAGWRSPVCDQPQLGGHLVRWCHTHAPPPRPARLEFHGPYPWDTARQAFARRSAKPWSRWLGRHSVCPGLPP
jgi:hypothetical protein